MRASVGLALASAMSWAAALPARAEPVEEPPPMVTITRRPPETGFSLGARIGYGIPFGRLADAPGARLTSVVTGMVPVWLDLGYRLTPNLLVGLFAEYGIAFLDAAESSRSCAPERLVCYGSHLAVGLGAQYHTAPGALLDPWLGVGIAYERLTMPIEGQPRSWSGLDFVHLELGLDVEVVRAVGVGPFVSLSAGAFGRESGAAHSEPFSSALHEWLVLGVRVLFGR